MRPFFVYGMLNYTVKLACFGFQWRARLRALD